MFLEARREYAAGPYVSDDLLIAVMRVCDGDPTAEATRQEASDELAAAKRKAAEHSCKGGQDRAEMYSRQKRAIVHGHADLFERVKSGKSKANCAAHHLRDRLIASGKFDWIPSVRTLHDWFSE